MAAVKFARSAPVLPFGSPPLWQTLVREKGLTDEEREGLPEVVGPVPGIPMPASALAQQSLETEVHDADWGTDEEESAEEDADDEDGQGAGGEEEEDKEEEGEVNPAAMLVPKLRAELQKRSLETSGLKPTLVDRLTAALERERLYAPPPKRAAAAAAAADKPLRDKTSYEQKRQLALFLDAYEDRHPSPSETYRVRIPSSDLEEVLKVVGVDEKQARTCFENYKKGKFDIMFENGEQSVGGRPKVTPSVRTSAAARKQKRSASTSSIDVIVAADGVGGIAAGLRKRGQKDK